MESTVQTESEILAEIEIVKKKLATLRTKLKNVRVKAGNFVPTRKFKPGYIDKVMKHLREEMLREGKPVNKAWVCDTLNCWLDSPMGEIEPSKFPHALSHQLANDNRFEVTKDEGEVLYTVAYTV